MKRRLSVLSASIILALVAFMPATAVAASPPAGATRQVPAGGTTHIRSGLQGPDGLQQPELRPGRPRTRRGDVVNRPRPGFKNGKFPKNPLDAPTVPFERGGRLEPRAGPQLRRARTTVTSGSPTAGNQWTLEPPDQGLCVGNGYVVETVNSVIRVWDTRRQRAHRRPGPEYVLRLPGRDRPDDRCRRSGRHRPAVLLRP